MKRGASHDDQRGARPRTRPRLKETPRTPIDHHNHGLPRFGHTFAYLPIDLLRTITAYLPTDGRVATNGVSRGWHRAATLLLCKVGSFDLAVVASAPPHLRVQISTGIIQTNPSPQRIAELFPNLKSLTYYPAMRGTPATQAWPPRLTYLKLWYNFDHLLGTYRIPVTVTSLHLGHWFNQPLHIDELPLRLQKLQMSYIFNRPIARDVLRAPLNELHLGTNFNQALGVKVLPEGLIHLTISVFFNQDLDKSLARFVLPQSLKRLTFLGRIYHKIPPGVLPAGLTHLTFSGGLHHDIEAGVLPAGLTHLTIDWAYPRVYRHVVVPSPEIKFDIPFNIIIYHPTNRSRLKIDYERAR